MQFHPYLNFEGRCAEAFRFYQECFGGELELMTHGESPIADQVPPDRKGTILHAALKVGDSLLMASDTPPGSYDPPGSMYISITPDDVEAAERIFAELADGGKVMMPLEKTFWAERFGMVTDRFGIPWMLNYGDRT